MAGKKLTNINDETEFRKFVVQSFTRVDSRFDRLEANKVDKEDLVNKADKQDLINKVDKEDLTSKADKEDIDKLLTAVDAYANRADAYFQEMVMMGHDFKRHERWIMELAKKMGVTLDY